MNKVKNINNNSSGICPIKFARKLVSAFLFIISGLLMIKALKILIVNLTGHTEYGMESFSTLAVIGGALAAAAYLTGRKVDI